MEYNRTPCDEKPRLSNALSEGRSANGGCQWSSVYRAPWFAHSAWGSLLCTTYPLLILGPLSTFAVLSPHSHLPAATEIGVNCAVIAFAIIVLQFVISARFRWIEAPFGLDVLLQFHRMMAFVAFGLLCLHALLIASDRGWGVIISLRARSPLWAGRLALLSLVALMLAAIYRRTLRIRYEVWRRVHDAVAFLMLGLAFWHSFTLGDDVSNLAGQIIWATLVSVACGAWLFGRPWSLGRNTYQVVSVEREAPRVWTVALKPQSSRPLHYAPGQFQFLRSHKGSLAKQDHPFSIASNGLPNGLITLTIKESGDFTATIGRFKPGDLATVQGPFGRFSHVFHPNAQDLVFIAAGVGITPFMSMLRHMCAQRDVRRVLLIYANRTEADIVFRSELEAIESGGFPVLQTIHVLTQPFAGWNGEVGRVDSDTLPSLCGNFSDKTFFICCPPPMMWGLVRALRHAGVALSRIHADCFGL
jgi:predicted ferric reductase